MKRYRTTVKAEFLCPFCGNLTFPVWRNEGKLRKRGHRKWLYCFKCRKEVNTYEIRDYDDKLEITQLFNEGLLPEQTDPELAAAAVR